MQPTPTMQALLETLEREDGALPDPTAMPPSDGRALAAMINARWNTDLPDVARVETVMHGGLPARRITPHEDTGTDAILHIHGGGWAFCSALTHESAARRLAVSCGAVVVTPEYRLAPEAPFPAGLDDCMRAWKACDPSRRWSVAGDSAGANLSLALMLRLIAEGAQLPVCALLFYGVYGADFTTPSYLDCADGPGLTRDKMRRFWDWYVPESARDDPLAAPLLADDAALSALPPLYLNAAEIDPLRSESEILASRLRAFGRDDPFDLVDGVVHGFMQMGNALPEAREAFSQAGVAFKRIRAAEG
ncbi:MAG: alpha/beta hydrolase [Pseudomonadota bacterium]